MEFCSNFVADVHGNAICLPDISNFDGNNAVVVSYMESGGIGAVWALTKNGGSWGQTAFQMTRKI